MTIDVFSVKIRLDFSFFAVLTLMLLLSDSSITIMCFFSSMLHEIGHIIFMFAFSCKPSRIDFGAFGLRIKCENEILVSYQKQFFIAMGGIIVNFAVSLLSFVGYLIYQNQSLKILIFVNLFIALTNMFPIEALDMGRAVYCVLMSRSDEAKAENIMRTVSDVTVIGFTVLCILYSAFISINISLCAVCVYIILINRKRR